MNQKIHPVIVGAAQFTQRKNTLHPLDPLGLITKTCLMALNDAKGDELIDIIDDLYMVNINSWSYEDAPGELSQTLGIEPKNKIYLPDGGDSPQMLVNRAAKTIIKGESQASLITGGEAFYSASRAKNGKIILNWPEKKAPKYMEGKLWHGTTEFENKYGLIHPPCSYAMFETAIRAESGRSLEDHDLYVGKLFERFSRVASKNPYAWTQKSYTAIEIIKPTPENRYINYPYTKRMCSNMFVDQAGAVIITSEEVAEKLKINRKLWIYLMGGAEIKNIFSVAQRPNLYDSPAAREGKRVVLERAGLRLDDIDKFDIYSCFPSIVEIVRKEIGISDDDPRELTITGGLPYFGGPWSNYSLHSIITAVDLIRKDPSLKIMVVANGGYNTKQSFGIYGKQPPVKSWSESDDNEIQKSILLNSLPEPIEEASGHFTIEAYTFYYERDGTPKRGIAIGRLENGRRTMALINAKSEILSALEKQELVGKTYPVKYNPDIKRNLINITD